MEEKCRNIDKHNVAAFLETFDTVLCDCDGVIWNGNDPIEKSVDTLNKLQELGKKVILVTNNSSRTQKGFHEKCLQMNLNVKKGNIFCPSYSCTAYLKQMEFNKTVYVMGSADLSKELNDAGIKTIGVGPDVFTDKESLLSSIKESLDQDVGAVIVGYDFHASYSKLAKITNYLENPDCIFMATDKDLITFYGVRAGLKGPGVGVFVSALEACSGRTATVIGKPYSSLYKVIQKEHNGMQPEKTLMVGDTRCIDIVFGSNCGLQTLLVLSGNTTTSDISRWQQSSSPTDAMMLADYCLPKLGDLLPLMERNHPLSATTDILF